MKILLAILGALLLTACADTPTAPADNVQAPAFDMFENQFHWPFSGAFAPCGDLIQVTGEAHWFIKMRDSHMFQFMNVKGTGTRGNLEFVFHQTDVVNTFPNAYAPEFTHVSIVKLTGKGAAPNGTITMHWAMHATPDGRITAEIKKFETTCK